MNTLFDPAASVQLALTLGHFLWQGLLITAAAWAAGRALRRASARVRYRIYLSALFAMAASPAVTFVWLGREPLRTTATDPSPAAAITTTAAPPALNPDRRGFDVPGDAAFAAEPAAAGQVGATDAGSLDTSGFDGGTSFSRGPQPDWSSIASWLTAAYLAGVLAMSGRLALGLRGGRRLRQRSEPVADPGLLDLLSRRAAMLRLRAVPALAWCRAIAVPTVVGVLRPAILLPTSLTTGLAPDQLAAILTHELAHIRRWDPLLNVLQRVIEAGLFFHPLVWLVSRWVRHERENCCDDLVLALGSDPLKYASSLLGIAERAAAARQPALSALAALRADGRTSELGGRIRRLLGAEQHEAVRLNRPGLLGIVVAVVALGGFARLAITDDGDSAERKRKPARAILPDGTVVELVGVAVNPRDGRWWRPDGSPLDDVPKLEAQTWVTTDENSIERTFLVRGRRLPDDILHHVEVSPSRGGAVAAHREKLGQLLVHAHQTIPTGATTATVRFGFAAGEWDTVLILSPQGERQGEPAPLGRQVDFDRLTPLEDGAELVLRLSLDADGPRVEYRARVIDESGTSHGPRRTRTSRHDNEPLELTHEYGIKPDQIREIHVEVLPYRHWVTFRNVALHPGQTTDVDIDVQAPDETHEAPDPAPPGVRAAKARELTELEGTLIGTWAGYADTHGESYTFRADGTYEQTVTIGRRATSEGTWALDWEALPPILSLKVTRSDDAEFPVGTVVNHKVVRLGDKRLAFENPNDVNLPAPWPRPITYTRATEPAVGDRQEKRVDKSDKKPAGDLARLQGTWQAEVQMGDEQYTMRFTIEGRDFTQVNHWKTDGREITTSGEINLDETADPRQMTLEVSSMSSSKGRVPGRIPDEVKAIYKLDGDRLTWRAGLKDWPTEFEEGAQIVFNRLETHEGGQRGLPAGGGERARTGELSQWERKLVGKYVSLSGPFRPELTIRPDGTFEQGLTGAMESGMWDLETDALPFRLTFRVKTTEGDGKEIREDRWTIDRLNDAGLEFQDPEDPFRKGRYRRIKEEPRTDGAKPAPQGEAAQRGEPRRADVLGRWHGDDNGLAHVFFTLDLNEDGTFVLERRDTALQFETETYGTWELDSDRPRLILREKRWVEDGKAVEGRPEQTDTLSIIHQDGRWILNHRMQGTYQAAQ